jgi:hypothetical protein
MTADPTAAKTADVLATPSVLPAGVRTRILIYLSVLLVLLGLGSPAGGLIGLPISFLLKNKLHLKAHEMAIFALIAGVPAYVSFLFGFARDIWNPLGMGDRGFMVLFGGLCAALYVMFAFAPVNYQSLLVANLLLGTAFLLVSSAQNGLASALGQQHVMSGQVSTAWNIFGSLPGIAALILGGSLSDLMESHDAERAAHLLFLVGAAIMALAALYGLLKPASVFDNLQAERASDAHPVDDIKRLIRHWPIYPALLIWFLWNFAPGSGTPLQYYLQDALHAEDSQWGQWNAIFAASFIPTFLVLRRSMSEVPATAPAVLGHGGRDPAVCPAGVHPLRDGRPDRGGADRPDGRRRHGRLPGPDDPLLPWRAAGHLADDVRRALCDRRGPGQLARHEPLRSFRRLHRVRDRDHGGLCPDSPGPAAGAETADRHRGWANPRGCLHNRLGRGRRGRTRA